MKKILSFVLLAVILGTSLAISSFATDDTPHYSIDGATVEAGETFTIPVYISNNPGINGTKLFVYFDPELTCESITNGEVFMNSEITVASRLNIPAATNTNAMKTFTEQNVDPQDYNSACVAFLKNNDSNNTSNGVLFNVTMTAPSEPGTYFIGVLYSYASTFNSNIENVEFTYGSNEIVVEDSAPVVVPGDVNGDGKINTADLKLVKRYIAGGVSASDLIWANADLNGDNKVTATDLKNLKALMVGQTI